MGKGGIMNGKGAEWNLKWRSDIKEWAVYYNAYQVILKNGQYIMWWEVGVIEGDVYKSDTTTLCHMLSYNTGGRIPHII